MVRNRSKRRIKEILRQTRRLPATDLIVVGKPALARASFQDLRRELQRLIERARADQESSAAGSD